MLYITNCQINEDGYIGVKKKILAQIKVFEKCLSVPVYYTIHYSSCICLYRDEKLIDMQVKITNKKDYVRILSGWIEKHDIKYTYIRFVPPTTKHYIDLFAYQKVKGIKSVLEYPSNPYDVYIKDKRLILEDECYRNQIQEYIPICTVYGEGKEILGIPAISLINGVELSENPLTNFRLEDGKIIMIAVAAMGKWHGYDRVIEGMAEYYKKPREYDVLLRLVGEGTETSSYKQLVKRYNLSDKVFFYGALKKEELNQAYEGADIGLVSFAQYKFNVKVASNIKVREYTARGIPFVYDHDDKSFVGNEEYTLKVKSEAKPVDIDLIVEFYKRVRRTPGFQKIMRQKAEKEFTWDKIMSSVISFYKCK